MFLCVIVLFVHQLGGTEISSIADAFAGTPRIVPIWTGDRDTALRLATVMLDLGFSEAASHRPRGAIVPVRTRAVHSARVPLDAPAK